MSIGHIGLSYALSVQLPGPKKNKKQKTTKTKQKNIKECELLIDPFPLWWHGICDSGQSQIANLAGFRIARMAKEKQL